MIQKNIFISEYELGKLVEPMIWHYRPAKTFNLPDGNYY
jgi:hypothetical protein